MDPFMIIVKKQKNGWHAVDTETGLRAISSQRNKAITLVQNMIDPGELPNYVSYHYVPMVGWEAGHKTFSCLTGTGETATEAIQSLVARAKSMGVNSLY